MTRKGLSDKQRKLVKGIADGKTQRQAAIEAGYSPKTADAIASQELKKTKVQVAITDLMEAMGLDDASLLRSHKELIGATKSISCISGKDANGGTVDFVDVPDWSARAKGLEMAYKLKGKFIEKHELTGKDGGPIKTEREMSEEELLAIASAGCTGSAEAKGRKK